MDTKDQSVGTPENPTKEPYEKPSFRSETVFVTTALSCGKSPNTSFQCSVNPKVS